LIQHTLLHVPQTSNAVQYTKNKEISCIIQNKSNITFQLGNDVKKSIKKQTGPKAKRQIPESH
jgi:hypothetical protein